jgi:hypothetical protein
MASLPLFIHSPPTALQDVQGQWTGFAYGPTSSGRSSPTQLLTGCLSVLFMVAIDLDEFPAVGATISNSVTFLPHKRRDAQFEGPGKSKIPRSLLSKKNFRTPIAIFLKKIQNHNCGESRGIQARAKVDER